MSDHHQSSGHGVKAHGDHAHGSGGHASVKLYWVFAGILCFITFMEWLVFKKRTEYGISNQVLVISLLTMSLVKFVMVCGWYMHLRYDKKILTNVFIVSMLMASATFIAINFLVKR